MVEGGSRCGKMQLSLLRTRFESPSGKQSCTPARVGSSQAGGIARGEANWAPLHAKVVYL